MKITSVPYEPTRFWVESETRPDLLHLVDADYEGRWACSCEDCMVRLRECKHIRAVRETGRYRILQKPTKATK